MMTEQITEAPPIQEDAKSAQSCEGGAGCTRAEYEKWWGRATELRSYVERVPAGVTDRVSMTDRKNKLVYAFDQLVSPNSVSEPVSVGDVKGITSWISHAEGFIGFLLQSYEPAPPVVQVPVLVKGLESDEDWHWPWIDGWDDPKKRKRIINPPSEKESQMKKLLIGGALVGGALYIGKRFMEAE